MELQGDSIVALVDNDPLASPIRKKVPLLIGLADFTNWLAAAELGPQLFAAVAIGGGSGAARRQIAHSLRSLGLRLPPVVHPSAVISQSAFVRDGVQVLANTAIAPEARVDEDSIINNSVNVDHECRSGKGVHIAPGATLCGNVTIEDYAFIGAGAVILPRITVGTNAIVAAGATVTRDVRPGALVLGCPAKERTENGIPPNSS